VKELLSRAAVPFTAKNVDEDDQAYDELIARGMRSVPVTIIGDRALIGFHPVELADAIEAWRGGRP
jgi:glutaredoxin-like protein NrdH